MPEGGIFLLLFSLAVLSTTETDLIAEEQTSHYPLIEIEKPHPPTPPHPHSE